MRIDGSSPLVSPTVARALTDLRSSFEDLNRQLTTGKKADTYGGLGNGRSISLAMRSRLSEIDGFRSTITDVKLRVDLMSTTLTRINDLGTQQRSDTSPTENTLIGNGQTRAQLAAGTRFQEVLSLLRTDVNGRHLFAGRSTEAEPVLDAKTILDGSGTQVGLRQVIAERRLADRGTVEVDLAGTDTVGRLSIAQPSGTGFTLTEDGVHPFGFKLVGGSTSIAGASVSPASGGPPASVTIDMPSQPTAGQTVRLTVQLPDGTRDEITLTATTNAPKAGEFQIGASASATLKNLRDGVVTALNERSRTTLAAASSVTAAQSFFAAGPTTPPKRVPAPPETATTLVDGTASDTVTWYTGDDDPSVSARDGISAQIDRAVSVSYGVRANEAGITKTVAALAIFAAETYTAGDTDQPSRHQALADRVRSALGPSEGVNTLSGIQVELAGVQRSMKAISERHDTIAGVTQDLIDNTENADTDEVATKLLAVNTRLQATYQTTSMLSQLSLVNYL